MRKVLAQSVLAATVFSTAIQDHPALEQVQSFVMNVTISNYMPNIYLGAGANSSNASNQMPMLVSLLGSASWVWSANCTNSVPGALTPSCSSAPVGVLPVFDNNTMTVGGSPQSYLGLVSSGGYSAYSTKVNISTPCIQGLINNPVVCYDNLEAVMAYNITADNWLIDAQLNTTGTLGLGIMSPFWLSPNSS